MFKPTLVSVSDRDNVDDICTRLVAEFTSVVEEYGFARDKSGNANPKMMMTLLEAVRLSAEQRFAPVIERYLTNRLEEQVKHCMKLGFHHVSGHSPETFREALRPLIKKTMSYFLPEDAPSPHPVVDGEFTLMLVLPPSWVPLRHLLMKLLDGKIPREAEPLLRMESRMGTRVAPSEPYVLVGIDGGRTLRGRSISDADKWIVENRRTYLSVHELVQLLFHRPHFLSHEHDSLRGQSSTLALGEKCQQGIVCFAAGREGERSMLFHKEENIHGGEGVGKPYYTTMITA